MDPETFLPFVRDEFAPVAERYGMREIAVSSSWVLKNLHFTSDRRAVVFYFDVRDGYLDALYAEASVYGPDGQLAAPAIENAARQMSMRSLLRGEGVCWPTRESGLFDPGVLEKAVRDLIAGIERHSREVFRD